MFDPNSPLGKPMPPEIEAQIDPNDPLQSELLNRAGALSDQEIAAMKTGISQPALAALKKIVPEIGFLLDLCGQGPAMPAPDSPPPADAGKPAPFQTAKPTTALGRIGAQA
jgi:hypothetical protein